jgi:hypothetical protein
VRISEWTYRSRRHVGSGDGDAACTHTLRAIE